MFPNAALASPTVAWLNSGSLTPLSKPQSHPPHSQSLEDVDAITLQWDRALEIMNTAIDGDAPTTAAPQDIASINQSATQELRRERFRAEQVLTLLNCNAPSHPSLNHAPYHGSVNIAP